MEDDVPRALEDPGGCLFGWLRRLWLWLERLWIVFEVFALVVFLGALALGGWRFATRGTVGGELLLFAFVVMVMILVATGRALLGRRGRHTKVDRPAGR